MDDDRLSEVLEHLVYLLNQDRRLRDADPPRPMRQMRRIGWRALLDAIPGLAVQFKAIPAAFWTDNAGVSATVACPCGECPEAPAEGGLACVCERIYIYSKRVYVANSPDSRSRASPAVAQAPAST